MDISEFEVDPGLYEGGKRLEFGEGSYITIRAAGSERASKVRERLWKPYVTWKEIPSEIQAKLSALWIAQGLLAEFVGWTDKDKPLSFDLSKSEDQNRLGELLAAPKFRPLRNRIVGFAVEESNFQAAQDEVLEKNSESSPAGASSGANEANQ